MKAKLVCECGRAEMVVEAPTLKDLGPALSSAVVAFHAGPPHCPHTIQVEMEDNGSGEDYKDFYIRCLRCEGIRELRTRAPKEMLGALTLLFHTAHEGHGIEIIYDGNMWRSPSAG